MQILIFFTVMTYEDLSYNRTYKYPHWALRFGWLLSVSSVICIPIYALFKCLKTPGSLKEVSIYLNIVEKNRVTLQILESFFFSFA